MRPNAQLTTALSMAVGCWRLWAPEFRRRVLVAAAARIFLSVFPQRWRPAEGHRGPTPTCSAVMSNHSVKVDTEIYTYYPRQCCGSVMYVSPGSRIPFSIPDPGSEFFPPRLPDPYFNPKKLFLSTRIIVHRGSGSWVLSHPGSRIQGSKRHRITDPEPQHCPRPPSL